MRVLWILLLLVFNGACSAQSLFEDALSGEEGATSQAELTTFELNGYIRGVLYGGEIPDAGGAELKSGYAEAALKLRARGLGLGDGFAELRFRRGREFGQSVSESTLREAYVNAYLGRFDFRIGHQIVVWGRADGLNPTNNITPSNMLARSPDEDDRREANFLIRSFFNLSPLRFEAIWIPYYEGSVIPAHLASLPPGLVIDEPDYPDENLRNGAFAGRLSLELASFDGSISYFNGYNPFPGLEAVTVYGGSTIVRPRAYRMHCFGADFSTTVGSYGVRGEFALRDPHEDSQTYVHVPDSDFQYVVGIDTERGNLSVILQYIGRYVMDHFIPFVPADPADIPAYQIRLKNRMFSSQQDETSHWISFRPALTAKHETLSLELFGMYKLTTEELFLKPKITYDIADALTVVVGGEFYDGDDDTLFGTVDSELNTVFLELKSSF